MSDDKSQGSNRPANFRRALAARRRPEESPTESAEADDPSTFARGQGTATEEPARTWPTDLLPMQHMLNLRKRRKRNLLRGLGLLCALPSVLVFLYMWLLASPRYVTTFQITYQTYQPPQSLNTGLVQTFLGTSAGSTVDLSALLYEYIRSPALLTALDQQLQLRQYYSNAKVDWFSRMGAQASIDSALRYFRWYVSVAEGEGGYLTISVQAFDQQYAAQLAEAITKACDHMVDQLTARARQDEVRSAQALVKQAQEEVNKARVALADFQNKHSDLNPQNSASQLSGIVGSLEGDLATQRAMLAGLQSTAPNSPQVSTVKTQIEALEGQLKHQQRRLASNSGGTPYSDLLDDYSALQLQQDFAKSSFLAVQQGLSVAIADAARKQNYLIDFAPPFPADNLSLKLAFDYALTTFFTTLALFGIGSLLIGAARDQAGL